MEELTTDQPEPERPAVPDSVRLQILATEHWSLLATRGMTWNETFTRTGTFLTVLSAAMVALALIAQATDFGQTFRLLALLVLPVVLLLGIGTYIRLTAALEEDFRLVAGMNRLRHAYLDIAPDLEPYFVTSHHDDAMGILRTYTASERNVAVGIRLGRILSGSPTIVAIIDCILIGLVFALVARLLEDRSVVYVTVGVLAALAAAAVMVGVVPARLISRFTREYQPRFPASRPPVEADGIK